MNRRTSELTKTLAGIGGLDGFRRGRVGRRSFVLCGQRDSGGVAQERTRAPHDVTTTRQGCGSSPILRGVRQAKFTSYVAILVFLGLQTVGNAAGSVSILFRASADHATVTSYLLEVFADGSDPNTASPIASSDLGKPAVDANGDITVDRSTFFNALAPGRYLVTVSSIGPGGSSRGTDVVSFVVSPSVTSLTPTSGAAGTAVTITGTNFGTTQGTSTVTFNGTAASPTGWSATSISTPVPAGATTGPVVVTVNGVASNGVAFTIAQAPGTPTPLNPTNGSTGVGTTPTLTWSATGATSYDVRFGASNPPPTVAVNQSVASYAPGTLNGATTYYWQIVARNADGATTGPIWTFTTGSGSPASYALIAHRVDPLGPNGGTGGALDTTGADILFVLEAYANNSGAGTLTDNKGNTWSQLTKQGTSGSGATVLWYAKNAIVGSGHRFTITGNSTYSAIAVAAFSGSDLTAPFDIQSGHSLSNSATDQPGSVTPAAANELVITGLEFNNAPVSVDSGVTILDQAPMAGGQYFGVALGYTIQTAATSINPTWRQTVPGQLASIMATFK
jgi:hypothetical protein